MISLLLIIFFILIITQIISYLSDKSLVTIFLICAILIPFVYVFGLAYNMNSYIEKEDEINSNILSIKAENEVINERIEHLIDNNNVDLANEFSKKYDENLSLISYLNFKLDYIDYYKWLLYFE